jgi:hypothetical protein
MSPNPPNLGPLPKGDRADDLQQQSLTAFRAAVPVDRFLFRDERVDDKGVDVSLELKANGCFTNIRTQVQLKSTDRASTNADGSVSLQVDVSNLNYMLNGPSPLYLLWIAPTNELRYAWAQDEARRLHEQSPDWDQQGKVTLRFSAFVTRAAWDDVYARVLREGQLQRQVHDRLAQATTAERIVIRIDPKTLATTDSDQAYQVLSTSGLAVVAAGYAGHVLSQAQLLTPTQMSEPRIQLVCGYAAATLGDYFAARGHLGRATAGRPQLTQLDGFFLDSLLLTCDFHVGRIGADEFRERRLRIEADAPPAIAMQVRLDRLRRDHLAERDDSHRSAVAAELRREVACITADPDATASMKLEAQIVQLYAEGGDLNLDFIRTMCRFQMRAGMGREPATPRGLAAYARNSEEYARLDGVAIACVREATRLQHPLLLAEAFVTRAVIHISRVVDMRFWVASGGGTPSETPEAVFRELHHQIEQAASLFKQAECTEGEVRATLLLADWLEINGQAAQAREYAQRVEGLARGLGYARHVQQVEEHLSGQTDFRRLMSLLTDRPDLDTQLASSSDEEIRRFAADCAAAMELPPIRLPVVERECFSMRAVAQEQLCWCRHLEMEQDLRHTWSRATSYLTDPERECVCRKLGHRTRLLTLNWEALIEGFKRTYCTGCVDRSPRQPP